MTMTASVVSRNTVHQSTTSGSGSDGGGGIYSDGGDMLVLGSSITDNTYILDSSPFGSSGGGGIYSAGGDMTLAADTIDGNTFTLQSGAAGDNGGGVYSEGGYVSIISSSIDGNTATVADSSTDGQNGGGGLYSDGGDIMVSASSISANSGIVTTSGDDNGGGAVFDNGSDQNIYGNSTLSANSMTVTSPGSHDVGGAIFTFSGGSATDVTIAGNHINQPGGAVLSLGPFVSRNTVLADNPATPAGNCAGASTFTSAGFNLESANTCGLNATGDLVNTEPQLGPLQNNGGPTPTQALTASGPAVDAGSCTDAGGNAVSFDQRGFARPQPAGGRCDIGAFELQPAAAPPPARRRRFRATRPPPAAPRQASRDRSTRRARRRPRSSSTGSTRATGPAAAPPSSTTRARRRRPSRPTRACTPCRRRRRASCPMPSITSVWWRATPPAPRSAPIRLSPRPRVRHRRRPWSVRP
jgi:hypothetical protein